MKARTVRNPLKLARKMLRAAPLILPKYFTPDCCIAATRAALDVFARFGVESAPVACRAVIFNPAYRKRCDEGRPCPDEEALVRAWDEDGSWTVAIGHGHPRPGQPGADRPGYNGHLCLAMPERNGDVRPGLVLDLTLAQASRPQRNILLGPTLFRPAPEFWAGHADCWVDVNGCAVGYHRLSIALGSEGYLDSPNWRFPERFQNATDELYRACL